MLIKPVTLTGRHVRLEPLSRAHHAGLCEVGLEPELWRLAQAPVATPEDMMAYINAALDWEAQSIALPFATIEASTSRVVGSTRFGNIDRANRHVEIGWTWVGLAWQRTAINTEAKYLMLCHAFETLGCLRVELKTDSLNWQSRNAILRIGARQEGIFRNHMVTASGRIRHTVYFSITREEWPSVKARLEAKLCGTRPALGPVPIDSLDDAQTADLHRLFQGEWWTQGRALDDVRRMVEHSGVIVAYCDAASKQLLAFGRVVTDFVYKALVLDVVVDPAHRGRGLGRALLDRVVEHPSLREVRHFELYCRPELIPFYRKWGFNPVADDLCLLRRA